VKSLETSCWTHSTCPRVVPQVVPRVPRSRTAVGVFFAAGGALVADVLPWSVVRPKLAQMLVLDVPLFRETGVFSFWARDRVPGSWYGSGSGCVMNNACSAEDSGVLKASSSSLSSFRTLLLGLRRLGPARVSSPSSS